MKQSVVAVILAAGRGLRMGGELPKQYLELEGQPILAHTLAAFDKASSIDALVIVSNDIEHVKERVLMPYPVSKPVFLCREAKNASTRSGMPFNSLRNVI